MTREERMSVWVVETGDYEQRRIFGIYSSIKSAVEHIKAGYTFPYIVTWEMAGDVALVGHFGEVPGYSTQHTETFDIERWEVNGN